MKFNYDQIRSHYVIRIQNKFALAHINGVKLHDVCLSADSACNYVQLKIYLQRPLIKCHIIIKLNT